MEKGLNNAPIGGGSRADKCLLAPEDRYKFAWYEFQKRIKNNSSMTPTLKVSLLASMGDVLSEVEESIEQ